MRYGSNPAHLKEGDLMLEARIRRVRRRSHQREVVVKVTSSEVLRRLGNNLRTLHGLSVPERSAILLIMVRDPYFPTIHFRNAYNSDFNTLSVARICRILVIWRNIKVFRRRTRSMNVPLPGLDLV